jgi:hypothetical protein
MYREEKDSTVLIFDTRIQSDKEWNHEYTVPDELKLWRDREVAGAWDGESFGIRATNKYKHYLKSIYDAILAKDALIFLGGGMMAFENAGLHIVIASLMPEDVVKKCYDADKDNQNMHKAADATGIKKRVEKAGKGFFALSPRWRDEKKKEVVFWLNPMEQDKTNFGWFTVQDLDDWIAGKGKIPMTKEQMDAHWSRR